MTITADDWELSEVRVKERLTDYQKAARLEYMYFKNMGRKKLEKCGGLSGLSATISNSFQIAANPYCCIGMCCNGPAQFQGGIGAMLGQLI